MFVVIDGFSQHPNHHAGLHHCAHNAAGSGPVFRLHAAKHTPQQKVSLSICLSVSQSVLFSVCRSVSQYQSISQPVCLSVSQSLY